MSETAAWNALVAACARWAERMDQWEQFQFETKDGPIYVSLVRETFFSRDFVSVPVPETAPGEQTMTSAERELLLLIAATFTAPDTPPAIVARMRVLRDKIREDSKKET